MKRRMVSLLMAALLTVTLFPMAAWAEGEEMGFYTAQAGGEENRISGRYNYLEHYEGERVVWLVSENGFSATDQPTLSLAWNFSYSTDEGTEICNEAIPIPAGGVERVARPGSEPEVYDYSIDLSCVKTALSSVLLRCRPVTYLCQLSAQIDEQTATLEIAIPRYEGEGISVGGGYILSTYHHFEMDDTSSAIYMKGSWSYTGMPDFEYVGVLKPVTIEGNIEYLIAPQSEIQWTINRVWMEHIVGDGGTWSFDENEKVTVLQNPTLPIGFYGSAPGCYSQLIYEVTVVYGGNSSTYVLGFNMDWLNTTPPPKLERGDDDTVEALNEALKSMESYSVVTLGNTTYKGIIEIPEGKVIDFQGAQKTIIEGGINVPADGGVMANQIHFQGTQDRTQAVIGSFTSSGCSFTGYKIAIGTGQCDFGSLFIRNEVAMLLDDPSGWPIACTFIENGTAIQIENLGSFYRPYMFRIYECNFIDNDVDFDVSVPGTFYFNRNYYGTLKQSGPAGWYALAHAYTETAANAVIERSGAKITEGAGTTVVSDVVYKYPVLYWWKLDCPIEEIFDPGEVEPLDDPMWWLGGNYTNVLTTDWNNTVQLASDDEESMVIEAEAFAAETEGAKEISVMNEGGSAVGTWNFGGGEG